MKKIKLQILVLILTPLMLFSQTLNIHKNDGSINSFSISEIDSITFTNSEDTSEFIPMPLQVGNSWTYVYNNSSGTSEITNSIISTQTINDVETFVLNDDWLWDNDGCYIKDGNLFGLKISEPNSSLEIVFPNRPNVGDIWMVDGKEFTLEAINEIITVPAGVFSCYRIFSKKNTDENYLWWSIGKGIIKSQSTYSTSELKSMVLN